MNNKVVIVTAASQGIGKACAMKLSENGCLLSLMSRTESINEVNPESNHLTTQGDVRNRQDLEKIVEATLSRFSRIDGVVNNTGHTAKGELTEIKDSDWINAFELAFLNVTRMAQLVVPIMRKQKAGSIVNISSFAALEPSLKFPTSSVIRAGISSYTKLFSNQFAKENIRMNCVLPGYVDNYPVDAETLKTIPADRPAKAREIANLVAFLISDASSYINGQSILVDGGLNKSI